MTKMVEHLPKGISRNWKSWEWWKHRYRIKILPHILRRKGTYVVDERWDNLIILDACRYDKFSEVNTIEGKLESRISRGSVTEEFLLENFGNHPKYSSFNEIVYVTANPFVNLLLSNKFHRIYPVWDYGWDDDLDTVPPANVVKDSLEAYEKNPGKRLIIHFMQPHSPFLGTKLVGVTGFARLRNAVLKDRSRARDAHWSDLVRKGELRIEEVMFAYEENLRVVLSYVKELIDKLPGRTVVTSDHGNLFGEIPHVLYPFKEYGHHIGLRVRQLVLVPWLIVDGGKTRRDAEKIRIRSKIHELKKRGKV